MSEYAGITRRGETREKGSGDDHLEEITWSRVMSVGGCYRRGIQPP